MAEHGLAVVSGARRRRIPKPRAPVRTLRLILTLCAVAVALARFRYVHARPERFGI
jgi:hypothetical protein